MSFWPNQDHWSVKIPLDPAHYRLPVLAEIRDQVLREYQADQRKQQKNLVYERLREGYEISVDPLVESAPVAESNAVQ